MKTTVHLNWECFFFIKIFSYFLYDQVKYVRNIHAWSSFENKLLIKKTLNLFQIKVQSFEMKACAFNCLHWRWDVSKFHIYKPMYF